MEYPVENVNMSSQAKRRQSEEILPFEVGYLPPFAIKTCEKELKETPEGRVKGIRELRSLLQGNEKSGGVDFCEDFLVSYLRRSKYRVEDAQQQILNLFRFHEKENVFGGVPEEYLDLPSSKYLVLLPKRCRDACAIFLCRWGKWDPSELPHEGLKQILVMQITQALRDPMNQIHGFKIIHDFEGMSLKQLKYFTPSNLLLFYNCTVNCFPMRYKEVHLINQSPFVKLLWRTIKPVLSEKIRSRVRFHDNLKELFDFFPRSIMPTEYGGEIREVQMDDWVKRANKEQENFTLRGQPNCY